MKKHKRLSFIKKYALICLSLVALVFAGYSQGSNPLASDSTITQGKLENGLTYYIKKNNFPENQAIFMLVVKVGSIVENENELGFAHFTEHMAFKGTKRFPGNELRDYLTKKGIHMGLQMNAVTSHDYTMFHITIPTTDTELLANCLRILRDWAGDIAFESDAIDSERGVILAEKLQTNNLHNRVSQKTMGMLTNNSRYADRHPIGSEEILTNFQDEEIKQFYRRWYRPDLQSVIVVGNVNEELIKSMVEDEFSSLTTSTYAPKRPDYKITLNQRNEYLSYTDPDITHPSVELYFKRSVLPNRTENTYRGGIVTQIFNNIVRERIQEEKSKNRSFENAEIQIVDLFPGIGAGNIRCVTSPGQIEEGLAHIFKELHRIKIYGFTQQEIERMKSILKNAQENNYNNRDRTPSVLLAMRYMAHFTSDVPVPTSEQSYKLFQKVIDSITLEEVNELINWFYAETDRDIMAFASENDMENLLTEQRILAIRDSVFASEITPYLASDYSTPLMENLPPKGSIIDHTYNNKLDLTKLTLSNGATAYLKPMPNSEKTIFISAFSKGGTSLYNQNDFQSAINAVPIVSLSGLGPYDANSLNKKLSEKNVAGNPYLGDYFEGFRGSAEHTEAETLLQLIHLYFTSPNLDTTVATGPINSLIEQTKIRYNYGMNIFGDTINNVINGHHWRKKPRTIEQIKQLDPKRAFEIYKERFGNASDFTFIISGNFQVDSIKPLIEHYIASLPFTGEQEELVDMGIERDYDGLTRIIRKGDGDQASVRFIINGEYEYNYETVEYFNALQTILGNRVHERLRHIESGVYSTNTNISCAILPDPYYQISVAFTCESTIVDLLINAAKEEIEILSKNGPTEEELRDVVTVTIENFDESIKSSRHWHNQLNYYIQLEEDPIAIVERRSFVESLNLEKFKRIVSKYLDSKRIKTFILLPEETEK